MATNVIKIMCLPSKWSDWQGSPGWVIGHGVISATVDRDKDDMHASV